MDSMFWPRIRHKRYPLMNHLSVKQKKHLKFVIDTFVAYLHDPAAVEILMVLLEVCFILDLLPCELERLFTPRILKILDTYGDVVPPKQRPLLIHRPWVWLSNQPYPKLHRLEPKGKIRIKQQGTKS